MKQRIIRSLIVFAINLLSLFFLLLPWSIALALGACLGRSAFFLLKRERRKSESHFLIAFGNRYSPEERRRVLLKSFENLGRSVAEVLKFSQISAANIDRFVTFEGEERLKEAFSRKKGIIFVTAHFGNWEMMGIALAIKGYPTHVVAAPLYDSRLDHIMIRYRNLHGVETITRGSEGGGKRILSALKRNHILGLLIDQDIEADGVFVKFFDRMAYTPSGAASLALKSGAAVIFGFIVRESGNTHRVMIEGPVDLIRCGDRREEIRVNTALFTRAIEEQIRKMPDHWVWMHNRWQTREPAQPYESS